MRRRLSRDGRIYLGMINDWYKRKSAKVKALELAGSLSKEDAEALRRTTEEIREGIGARMKALVNEGRKY